MGWKGLIIGGCFGWAFGGPLGAVLGAAFGHQIEEKAAGKSAPSPRGRPGARRRESCSWISGRGRGMVFCASAAAMMAKLAKADGRVSQEEIRQVEAAFARLGFSAAARNCAIDAFRRAKDDRHTIYEYAVEFAAVMESVEVRELFYEILWDVACADGHVEASELDILRRIPVSLRIRSDWFAYFASERLNHRRPQQAADPLREAYVVLGASPNDSADELKAKYRELAKRNHPDALRAQGLPEEMVSKANEKMGRINAAWKTVREARNL